MVDLCIVEMTRNENHMSLIQNPSMEILVAIGRKHCNITMSGLSKQLAQGHPSHFMVLHSIGTLATANISGIIPSIKTTLETILPTLGMIKLDHVKQAYAFGEYEM